MTTPASISADLQKTLEKWPFGNSISIGTLFAYSGRLLSTLRGRKFKTFGNYGDRHASSQPQAQPEDQHRQRDHHHRGQGTRQRDPTGYRRPRDIRVVRSELKLKIDDSLTAGVPAAGDANGESSDGVAEEVTDDLGPRQNSVTLQRFLQTRSQPATANATNAQPRKTNQPGSDQRSAVPAA